MLSDNKIILASAGSGKTTTIVGEACGNKILRSMLVTYTINSRSELSNRAYIMHGAIPPHVTISTWYAFILRHFIRPYQNHLYAPRVTTINFKHGQTARYIKKSNVQRFYFSSPGRIRLDKVTNFVCSLIEKTNGLPLRRFERICDHIYIDEAQDLSGYDLELIEHLLKTSVRVTLIGDHRQATYSTNDNAKNKKFVGAAIIDKFKEWRKADLCEIEYHTHSHRCIQEICDFSDQFHPDFPSTKSLNETVTGHDGVFAVEVKNVPAYSAAFDPQPLRYDRRTKDIPGRPMNFGAVKGMTFDRTLIYPHGPLKKFLETGDIMYAGKELGKLYVAITRARQSVAFVIKDGTQPANLQVFEP